jgi:nucleoside-diphosphate-sugar epimerase
MHVLVIGGNRFVGRLLAWRLLARGDRVTLLNRGSIPDPFGDRVERLRGDRTRDLEPLLAGRSFDAVVDLAAFTGEDGRRATELLAGRTRHLVMVSTGQVYLVREGCVARGLRRPLPDQQSWSEPLPACPRPSREEDYDGPVMPRPADPADLGDWEYGIGKRACEDALVAAARAGFPSTRVRIPMVNGELDYFRRIEGYLWRLVDGGPVLVPDGGGQPCRHVYGGEVARFLADILLREDTFGQAYNVAQEEAPTLLELLERLRALLGSRADLVAIPSERLVGAGLAPSAVSPFSDRWMSFVDPGRAARELGFRHATLDRGLSSVVACFLAHPPADRPDGYAGRRIELRLAGR